MIRASNLLLLLSKIWHSKITILWPWPYSEDLWGVWDRTKGYSDTNSKIRRFQSRSKEHRRHKASEFQSLGPETKSMNPVGLPFGFPVYQRVLEHLRVSVKYLWIWGMTKHERSVGVPLFHYEQKEAGILHSFCSRVTFHEYTRFRASY